MISQIHGAYFKDESENSKKLKLILHVWQVY